MPQHSKCIILMMLTYGEDVGHKLDQTNQIVTGGGKPGYLFNEFSIYPIPTPLPVSLPLGSFPMPTGGS